MKLDELLDIARHMRGADREEMRDLGTGILDLLGESQDCGWPEPRVEMADDNGPYVSVEGVFSMVPARELRSLCTDWLRACDEADAMLAAVEAVEAEVPCG